MAYVTPPTFAAGNTLLAADLNILGGDLTWLKAALAVIGQTSDTVVGPVIGRLVGVRATRTTDQSISSGSATSIQLTSEDYDTDGFHSTSSNTQRLTVPAGMGGYYLMAGGVRFAADATGRRSVYIERNGISGGGTSAIETAQEVGGSASQATEVSTGASVILLSPGDFVALTVSQTSGGNLNVNVAALWMVRIGKS